MNTVKMTLPGWNLKDLLLWPALSWCIGMVFFMISRTILPDGQQYFASAAVVAVLAFAVFAVDVKRLPLCIVNILVFVAMLTAAIFTATAGVLHWLLPELLPGMSEQVVVMGAFGVAAFISAAVYFQYHDQLEGCYPPSVLRIGAVTVGLHVVWYTMLFTLLV